MSAGPGGVLGRIYTSVARPVLSSKAASWIFLLLVGAATLGSLALFATKDVTVKLLPFDNKSELAVMVDLPEGSSVEATDAVVQQVARAVMQLPEVEVTVFTGNPARHIATHRNEVPGVAKDCSLVFTIVNPHVVPEFATVEWTVRNEGPEADQRSDLATGVPGCACSAPKSTLPTPAGTSWIVWSV